MNKPITIPELRKWLGKYGRPSLSDEACERLINLLRHKDERGSSGGHQANVDDWDIVDWDIVDIAKAAKTLQAAVPRLAAWWRGMLPSDQTEAACVAVGQLGNALDAAMSYVAKPFGEYEKARNKKAKDWHLPCVVIANVLSRELCAAGHGDLGFTKNSIPVRVVREIIIRHGYIKEISKSAIASHIDRWWKAYGKPK